MNDIVCYCELKHPFPMIIPWRSVLRCFDPDMLQSQICPFALTCVHFLLLYPLCRNGLLHLHDNNVQFKLMTRKALKNWKQNTLIWCDVWMTVRQMKLHLIHKYIHEKPYHTTTITQCIYQVKSLGRILTTHSQKLRLCTCTTTNVFY